MNLLSYCFCSVSVIVMGLMAWRFFVVRSTGTQVILRRLPASGNHGWRHGIMHYRGMDLRYFKLRSLTPSADIIFLRNQVEIKGHRDATEREASFLSDCSDILLFSHRGTDYEAAFAPRAEMAFIAWVESAPDARMERIDPRQLQRKFLHP